MSTESPATWETFYSADRGCISKGSLQTNMSSKLQMSLEVPPFGQIGFSLQIRQQLLPLGIPGVDAVYMLPRLDFKSTRSVLNTHLSYRSCRQPSSISIFNFHSYIRLQATTFSPITSGLHITTVLQSYKVKVAAVLGVLGPVTSALCFGILILWWVEYSDSLALYF
ncbi:hypothetical protein IF1G_01145 [Cordyceps javanica]|uniref:Uncharacterized protein n=1 Tax=Cordyceps javanica TaxID=43265 RepID=A0A545VHL3_9HYPO|nr:hypothetical protein IF1G_01145 [Cordyceps javanica]